MSASQKSRRVSVYHVGIQETLALCNNNNSQLKKRGEKRVGRNGASREADTATAKAASEDYGKEN